MSQFYMPVRIFEENDAVVHHAADLAALGSKALIVTGRHSAEKNGSLDDVRTALESTGRSFAIFNDIEENPSVKTVMRARDFGLQECADFVIGIGGGSPMDASKAIALMMKHRCKDEKYLYSPDGGSETLPLAAVPTTCGTGSEVTAVSVLTKTGERTKGSIPHKIFPSFALIDGKYLRSASKSVLGNTAFDALTHLYESYLNVKATPMSRMCVDAGLREWSKSLDVLRGLREPDDTDRFNMMRASTMAGMAIAQTATTLPHGLSYPVTIRLSIPHGKATSYFTAGYLTEASAKDRDYLLHMAGFKDLDDFRAVNAFACGGIDAPSEDLERVLLEAVDELSSNPQKMALAPFSPDREMLRRIAFYEITH